jgi:hypothetical protein
MTSSDASLVRRLAPAVALSGASVLGILGLDHLASKKLSSAGSLTPSANTSPTTAAASPGVTDQATTPATQPSDTAASAGNQNGQTVPTLAPACAGTTTMGPIEVITDGRRQYGEVVVQVTRDASGKVCDVQAQYGVGDGRSQNIESYAIPRFNEMAKSTGAIQAISGATAVSNAYAGSLQAALDSGK